MINELKFYNKFFLFQFALFLEGSHLFLYKWGIFNIPIQKGYKRAL